EQVAAQLSPQLEKIEFLNNPIAVSAQRGLENAVREITPAIKSTFAQEAQLPEVQRFTQALDAVSKGDSAAVQQLQRALQEMRANPTLAQRAEQVATRLEPELKNVNLAQATTTAHRDLATAVREVSPTVERTFAQESQLPEVQRFNQALEAV